MADMSFLTPEGQEFKTDILSPDQLGVAIETGLSIKL